jgi:hypothetical protein
VTEAEGVSDEISIVAREGSGGWCKIYLTGLEEGEVLLEEGDGINGAASRALDLLLDLARQLASEIKGG